MIAAMMYAKDHADIETMASLEVEINLSRPVDQRLLQGLMGALYFGVGKSVGSLVGGLLIEELGVRNTFRCFGALSLGAASAYFLFTFLWEKRRRDGAEERERDTEADGEQESNQGDVIKKNDELGES